MVLAMDVIMVAFLGSWLGILTQRLILEGKAQSIIPKGHFNKENGIHQ